MSSVQSHRRRLFILLSITIFGLVATGTIRAEQSIRIGVVEGGDYVWHVVLRQLLYDQLPRLLPDSVEIEFPASAYVTSNWNETELREKVAVMVERETVDVVLAIGPWSVEALLDAGCRTPIVAMHRFDPEAEQLIDSTGRPIAENLTVTAYRERYSKDLSALFALMPAEKIGFLMFPSGDEAERVITKIRALGERADFEVVTAEGENNVGTFAFFKAYERLDKNIDALYISPTWGMGGGLTGEFLAQVARDKIPVLSSEGLFHVTRGAMVANNGVTATREAMQTAWKIAQIYSGKTPADLPVYMSPASGLTLNEQTAQRCGIPIDDYTASFSLVVPIDESAQDVPLALGAAISNAIASNPGYLAGYEAIEGAVKEAEAARAAYLPELSVHGRAGYVDDNAVGNSLPTESNWQAEGKVSLYQRIYSPSAIQQIKAIGRKRTDREISHRRAKLDLEQAVVLAYLNLVEAEQLYISEISQQQVISRFLEHEVARASLPESPVTTAQARWQSEKGIASQRLLMARANREIACVLVNALLGRPLDAVVVTDPAPFSAEYFESDAVALRSLIGTAGQRREQADSLVFGSLQENNELAAVDARLEAVLQQRGIAGTRYLPEVGFRADLGIQDKLENQFGFEEKPTTWGAGITLNWTLFRGGARGKQNASYELEASRVGFERDDEITRIRREATAGLARVSQAVFSGVLVGNAAIDAQTHVTAMARQPDTTLTLLLDAVQAYRERERAAIVARFDYYREASAVARTLGWSLFDLDVLPSTALISALKATGVGTGE